MRFPQTLILTIILLAVADHVLGEESQTVLSFGNPAVQSPQYDILHQESTASQPIFRSNKKQGLVQKISFGASWTPEIGSDGMGLAEANVGVTFGLPGPDIGGYGKSFFLLTPKFTYTNVQWDNPAFPSSLYNAGLNITWLKPCNEHWSIMLNAMPSYASDGNATSDAFRIPVMLGANWEPNQHWKVVFGVAYTDRGDYSVLPFGGVTYRPNDDWKFELLAPQARIAKRLHWGGASQWDSYMRSFTTQSEHWGYIGFGFGGGSWAVESVRKRSDLAMYREFSFVLGFESLRRNSPLVWSAELAYVFARKVEFDHHTQRDLKPDDSLAFRVKCSF